MANKNIFNSIQLTKPKKNTFDLTHDVKMSGKMGLLMPHLQMECVPGDSIKLGADTLLRFAPLLAPIMHRIDVTCHYFFVPNRLTWSNWEKFIVGEATGGVPTINITGTLTADQETFLDYMGIPPFTSVNNPQVTAVNAFPMAAYQMIYNEFYRDENLIAENNFALIDGDNSANTELTELRKRSWEHDYFTSALPWAQKGASVDIPLGDVRLKDTWAGNSIPRMDEGTFYPTGTISGQTGGIQTGSQVPTAYDPDGSLETTPTTINDLRRAFKLQQWLEKNARGGTRYIEHILTHYGVRSSDKRLQRPEYITGTKSPVIISEVLNTTGESAGLPQGNMAGHGVSVGKGYTGHYYAEEHGFIIGIMSVMPKTCYQQGVPKNYLKTDPTEWYFPDFAHIGEQPVTLSELYAYQATGTDPFGYVPRYAEYKYIPDRVAGEFRNTLDYWHLGRKFGSIPTLSQQFLEIDYTEVNRIFAVTTDIDNLYINILNKIKAVRPMPVFGTPMM